MAATAIARVRQQVINAINAAEWQTATGVGITSGAAILTANSAFVSTDPGKSIQVLGAGASGATLFTTILTYTSDVQVTLAANAGTTVVNSSATFGGRIDDQARSLLDVEYAAVDADAEVIRTHLSVDNHPHNNAFLTTSADLAYGDELPDSVGRYAVVEIKVASGDSVYKLGKELKGPQAESLIDQWRENPGSIFGATAHNVTLSPLGAYFCKRRGRIFFTGNVARILVSNFAPTYAPPTCQSDVEYEPLVVDGAIRRLRKEGDTAQVYAEAEGRWQQGLTGIRSQVWAEEAAA